jgi:hypothetical protein
VSKAVDIVANELIAVATPGEGFCLNFMLGSVVFSLPHLILDPVNEVCHPSKFGIQSMQPFYCISSFLNLNLTILPAVYPMSILFINVISLICLLLRHIL